FNGRIALLDTRVNEQTRAVIARAEFPNPGNRIRPGMMMRVAVHQGRRQSLAVPEAAVQYEGQGAFVYRIARGETGTTAQRVEVQTGAVESGFVEIVSGLGNNDRIVASGLNRIQPGAPVTVEGAEGGPPMMLSDVSVRRPVFAAVAAIVLCVIGAAAFFFLPVRELPDVDPPVVSVSTNYAGASAEVIESRITEPIEQQIAGIQGVERINSTSRDGRSNVNI
ncbi:hypothetical protein LTR94_029675, partial [Friedmanniomyces endolithicus]